MLKIYISLPVALDGPMVNFSDCQTEGRRSSHVVDVIFKLDRFFSFLYVKDTLVHIECEAVFRPRMPIFYLVNGK